MWYCSFQGRCQFDVENRFRAWNVEKKNWDKLLDYLIDENYLNEVRYVEAFVRGKFRKGDAVKHKATSRLGEILEIKRLSHSRKIEFIKVRWFLAKRVTRNLEKELLRVV